MELILFGRSKYVLLACSCQIIKKDKLDEMWTLSFTTDFLDVNQFAEVVKSYEEVKPGQKSSGRHKQQQLNQAVSPAALCVIQELTALRFQILCQLKRFQTLLPEL